MNNKWKVRMLAGWFLLLGMLIGWVLCMATVVRNCEEEQEQYSDRELKRITE